MFKRKKEKSENPLNSPGLISMLNPKSIVAEQFRMVRTNLEFSIVDKDLKSLLVTSLAPSAGKSTISANLAATFASQGKKVLLVDTDMRKPTIHKIFKLRNNDGLSTLITSKEATISEFIIKSEFENVYILPSGATPPNPAELISSKRMEQLIEEMERVFDLVIFDTPPVLAVADSQIMAGKVDGTLFVLRKGVDTKEQIQSANERMNSVNANVLGAIYNRIEPNDDAYYYEYI
ncbi:MAG: protein-tyrosine kinase [Carnobacterium sp.]|uniref:CpsD/CapB family tyrosine-protein kinase n=1 Tax=Carnobacterium sp. TaxID=48221 RepID=UPI0026495C9E|nr:CpsD/CapB family tyrosine-protein kinase [Carnobacterium sp.]MDN5372930.1 protein-tyrosine kinase [Carnobacterium sp.]